MSSVIFAHRQYLFDCEPVRMPDGRYGAMVIIIRANSGSFVTSRRFPDPEYFVEADHAVEHARQWAVDWIDQYG